MTLAELINRVPAQAHFVEIEVTLPCVLAVIRVGDAEFSVNYDRELGRCDLFLVDSTARIRVCWADIDEKAAGLQPNEGFQLASFPSPA